MAFPLGCLALYTVKVGDVTLVGRLARFSVSGSVIPLELGAPLGHIGSSIFCCAVTESEQAANKVANQIFDVWKKCVCIVF